MNTTKTYAAKSSVTRALKAAGLNVEDYTIVAVEGGFQGLLDTSSVHGFETHGFVACPHCGTHLSNGVGEDGQEVNGKYIRHSKFQFACLACGEEFGPHGRQKKCDRCRTKVCPCCGVVVFIFLRSDSRTFLRFLSPRNLLSFYPSVASKNSAKSAR
jgi:hypothetical protein